MHNPHDDIAKLLSQLIAVSNARGYYNGKAEAAKEDKDNNCLEEKRHAEIQDNLKEQLSSKISGLIKISADVKFLARLMQKDIDNLYKTNRNEQSLILLEHYKNHLDTLITD